MSDYCVVRESFAQFQVKKFGEAENTLDSVYVVKAEGKPLHLVCNCPRWSKRKQPPPMGFSCRHTQMVAEFLRSGQAHFSKE